MFAVTPPAHPESLSGRELITILALVQFVVIVDFMMVMPLGPDFAGALNIAHGDLGQVTASYTLSAAAAGLAGALMLDRFDRRPALILMLCGLGMATLATALVTNAAQLYAARALAGGFGGLASALSFAIVADRIPPRRRGRAVAGMMSGFTLASMIGVPLGLELARMGNWHTPFLAVGLLTLGIAVLVRLRLPALRAHLAAGVATPRLVHLQHICLRGRYLLAYLLVLVTLASSFLVVPHLATFAQYNLGLPRESLGTLYLVGGVASFASLQLAGQLADRHGPLPLFMIGSIAVLVVLTALWPNSGWSALTLITGFMVANSLRVVALNTLISQVPASAERAGFMALDSVFHYSAITLAGFASAAVLTTADNGALVGMTTLAGGAAVLILASLPLALWLAKRAALRLPSGDDPAPARASDPGA